MSDYKTGYGKPPEKNRFSKGVSGNPNGRPKGSKNLATILDKISNERMIVNENGRQIKLSKKEIALRQLMNKAMKGDIRALERFILEMSAIEQEQAEHRMRSSLQLNSQQEIALKDKLRLMSGNLIVEETCNAE